MAAIVHFTSTQAQDLALTDPCGRPLEARRSRPPLRVIEGGRSARSLSRRYARRRLVAAVVALVVVLALVVSVLAALDAAGSALGRAGGPVRSAGAATAGPVLVVQPGDTLWAIARRLLPTGDLTSLVDKLAAEHGPGPLLPGDRLSVAGIGAR